MTRTRSITYRCLDCSHEFTAGPGPVYSQARHDLPGTGHPASVDGACPACGGLYVGRLSWHALMTQPRAEAVVADRLRAAGHLVLFLHYLIAVKRTSRVTIGRRHQEPDSEAERIKRPVMPGYLFVGVVPPADFYSISKTPGVAVILRNESGPAEIPASEIERMRAGTVNRDGLVQIEEPGTVKRALVKLGSIMRIKSGPFQGFEGPVIRDDGKLVRVEADIFGRKTPVDVPYADVEMVAEAA